MADGLALKEFRKDPLKNILYSLAMENRENGKEIASKVLSHYFENKTTDEEIIQQYGEVEKHNGYIPCLLNYRF